MLKTAHVLIILYCLNHLLVPSVSAQIEERSNINTIEQLIEKDSFRLAIDKSKSLFTQTNSPLEQGRLLQLQADAYYYLNNIDSSLNHYLLAIEYYENGTVISNNEFYLECVSHAGFCYRELGNYDMTITYYAKALELAKAQQDTIEIAIQYANLGSAYGRLGDIEKAGNLHLKAYAIDLARKDTAALGFDLRAMAALEMRLGNTQKAIEHIKESIKLLELSEGNPHSLAIREGSLGSAYLEIGELDSAFFYLSIALNEHTNANDSIRMAFRWVDFSILYGKQKEYNKALSYAKNAQSFFADKKLDQHLILANLSIIRALNQLKNYDEAIALTETTINLCKKFNLLLEQEKAYKEYIDLLRKKHKYKEALIAFTQYEVLKDSILNIENKKVTTLIEIKYKVDKSEQENKILALENRIIKKEINEANFQLIAILIISLVSVGFIITFYYLRAKKSMAERLAQEMQVAALKERLITLQLKHEGTKKNIDITQINQELTTPLTEREIDTLHLSLEGLSNSEIGEKLFVSVNTIKFHLRNIYQKLGVSGKKEVFNYVAQSS